MAKLVSVSGLVFYVKDLPATKEFYEKLGFIIDTDKPDHLGVRLNWFWADFHPQDKENVPEFQKEAVLEPKGAGAFVYVKVDNVDEYHQELLDKGLKPSSKPRDWPWGNREFVIRDPSGYKIVFFNKTKKK